MIFDVAVKGAHARKCFAFFSSSSGCVCCYFPIRRNNKQLINSLAESIKAQGESMKSAPASSSRSSPLGGFCRACLRYKKSSHLLVDRSVPCLSRGHVSTLRDRGCAGASQPPSEGTTQAPAQVYIIQRAEVAPQCAPGPKNTPYPMPGALQGHVACRVPCGESWPWDSEGKCHMVMLHVERPNTTWRTGDVESTHAVFQSCS